MSALENNIKAIVANTLSVRESQLGVSVITALPYSLKSIEAVEDTLHNQGVEALKEIDYTELGSNSDSLIVCRCLTDEQKSYVILLLDKEELYESLEVLKLIEL